MAPFRSLKFRIALTIFALEAVMMVAALWQSSAAQTEAARTQQRATQDAVLKVIERVCRTALLTDEFSELRFYFEHLQRDPNIVRVVLGDASGRVVGSAEVRDLGQPMPALASGARTDWRVSRLESATGPLGTLAVQFSSHELLLAQSEARKLGFTIAAVGMTLIAVVGMGLGTLLTRRLGRLAEAARRMADGDRAARAALAGGDEVAEVGQAFDEMADAVASQERQLREQREYTDLLLASTAEAIFGVDTEGRCTFANASCLRMLGYASEQELIGRPMHELMHHTRPDGRPYPMEECKVRDSTQRGVPAHSDEEVHWRADGTSFPVEYWSHPVRRDGQVIGAVVTFVDVSERRRAEQALREERNFSAAVLSNAGALAVVLDREGRIRRFNRAAEQLSGHRFGDVEGRHPWDVLLPPEVAEQVRREAFEALAHHPERLGGRYTNQWMTADGRRRWIDWSNTLLLDEAGRMEFMVSIGVDITEQRAAEERIRVALHEKELLLREIYHRVKNNLQMVVSLLTLQSRNAPSESARAALVESARRMRAMALVHEQLYRAGDLTVIGLAPYVRQLLRDIVEGQGEAALRVPLESTVASMDVGIETAVPLGLIINELVSNAYKHAFPDGRRGRIVVTLRQDGDELELSVNDDGVGLPPGAESGREGSLGMRLVQSLVEQLGGTLDGPARPGGGTRFAIRFRMEHGERARLPEFAGTAQRTGPEPRSMA